MGAPGVPDSFHGPGTPAPAATYKRVLPPQAAFPAEFRDDLGARQLGGDNSHQEVHLKSEF